MSTLRPQASKGFTLIELLIVVAIIAILAAIAVPNFLEAQVRSKVSRAKADMRSVATALESYYVDYNRYPLAYSLNNNPQYTQNELKNPRNHRMLPLTTPVAYMTSLPLDVFSREEASNSPSANSNDEIRAFIYTDRYSYGVAEGPTAFLSTNSGPLYRILFGTQFTSAQWVLRSRGPVGTEQALGTSVDKRDSYDPTNGTVSEGNIIMCGPGIGFLDGK